MNKLSTVTLATLVLAVAGASTSALAQDPKPEDYGVFLAPQTQSVQSREAVRAEVKQARASEVRAENKPEDYGVFLPAQAQREVVRTAAPKKARAAADVRAEYKPEDYGVFVSNTPAVAKNDAQQVARAQ